MKRMLIVLLLVILLLCGCGKKETEETEERFVVEYRQTLSIMEQFSIIRDTKTGKSYLFVKNGYGGGLTILEEGK